MKKKGVMDDILRFDKKEFQGVLSDEERVQQDQLRAEWDHLAHLDEFLGVRSLGFFGYGRGTLK